MEHRWINNVVGQMTVVNVRCRSHILAKLDESLSLVGDVFFRKAECFK